MSQSKGRQETKGSQRGDRGYRGDRVLAGQCTAVAMYQGLSPMEAKIIASEKSFVLLSQAVCSPLNTSALLASGISCLDHFQLREAMDRTLR